MKLPRIRLKPNTIVRGPIFPEPVQVLVVVPLGESVKLIGKGLNTGQVYEPILNADQLAKLEITPEKEPFDGDAMRFRLGVEALRLGLAYEYDPYFSLSIARVDVIKHNKLVSFSGNEYLPIAQSKPIAQIGGNIFVYRGRFEVPLAAAISHTHRSGQFLRLNQVNEAVAEGRKAIELGAGDPRTHLSLGLALVRSGQKDEARRELETAFEKAKSNPTFRNAEVGRSRKSSV